MKRILFASVAVLLSMGAVEARWGRSCNTGCQPKACAPCEPVAPICCKTIMVPQTIQVPKVIEVPARRIEMPQPDICIRTPRPPVRIEIPCPPIPQPNRVEYRCQPDCITYQKCAPIIRYECPEDCQQS